MKKRETIIVKEKLRKYVKPEIKTEKFSKSFFLIEGC